MGVGVSVDVGVLVGVDVSVGVDVNVGVDVSVGVEVSVAVAVLVRVGVLVRVFVGVFVAVAVLVAVRVGVDVLVNVGVMVKVGEMPVKVTDDLPTAFSIPVPVRPLTLLDVIVYVALAVAPTSKSITQLSSALTAAPLTVSVFPDMDTVAPHVLLIPPNTNPVGNVKVYPSPDALLSRELLSVR